MNRRKFVTTLGLGMTGLLIPKGSTEASTEASSKENTKVNIKAADNNPKDYDELVFMRFKDGCVDSQCIPLFRGLATNYPKRLLYTSDLAFARSSSNDTVFILKNRFGCTGNLLCKDFNEQLPNIFKYCQVKI